GRRDTRFARDWSSDVCSPDVQGKLGQEGGVDEGEESRQGRQAKEGGVAGGVAAQADEPAPEGRTGEGGQAREHVPVGEVPPPEADRKSVVEGKRPRRGPPRLS